MAMIVAVLGLTADRAEAYDSETIEMEVATYLPTIEEASRLPSPVFMHKMPPRLVRRYATLDDCKVGIRKHAAEYQLRWKILGALEQPHMQWFGCFELAASGEASDSTIWVNPDSVAVLCAISKGCKTEAEKSAWRQRLLDENVRSSKLPPG